jgi:AraC-like DNA-binding protein
MYEVFGGSSSDGRLFLMASTLIAAMFQALLFTLSLITLTDAGFVNRRRVLCSIAPISVLSGVLFVVLLSNPEAFMPVLYVVAGLYCLQLVYYVVLFERRYARYRRRFDNFFAGEEYRRSRWIRNAFYMSACVGIAALAATFVNTTLYIVFTATYTVFYIYFAVRIVNYVHLFHRIAPVVAAPDYETEEDRGEQIDSLIEEWIERKGFIASEITLDGLAGEFSTNSAYLSRHINGRYGQNFRSWVGSLRIGEAVRLMNERPDTPLVEIAEQSGIPNTSSFYRQFSAVVGLTPAEYRKRSQAGK